MTFTLTNVACSCSLAEVLEAACLTESVDTEAISEHTWVARVPAWGAVGFVEAAMEAGFVVEAGAPRSLTADPTYAIAAQHLVVQERRTR